MLSVHHVLTVPSSGRAIIQHKAWWWVGEGEDGGEGADAEIKDVEKWVLEEN